jgi:hypothetical protein
VRLAGNTKMKLEDSQAMQYKESGSGETGSKRGCTSVLTLYSMMLSPMRIRPSGDSVMGTWKSKAG